MKNNRLSELPHLTQKSNLKILILGRNYLNSIEQAIPFLTDLQTLDVSNNQLDDIPENFYLLTNLQRLNFDANRLRTIPNFLKDMTYLSHLSLENNHFSNEEINKIQNNFNINLRPTTSKC